MARCIVLVLISLVFAVLACAVLPTVFLPKRWLDIKPGHERTAVHAVLGKPDADFAAKNFDGWHNSFGLGASVLTVNYDERMSRVVSTRIRTVWGSEYRDWFQEYKAILKTLPRNDEPVVPPESASNAQKWAQPIAQPDPQLHATFGPHFILALRHPAVAVRLTQTLGAQSMFAWIRRIGKTGAPPPREALLNQGLSLAMQWGDDWLKPIQGRLAQRFPVLSRDQLDELNSTCQAVMKFGHGAVYDLAEKYGKDTKREEFARVMSETYPWINEKNLSQLFSQGMYYAWKDFGFA